MFDETVNVQGVSGTSYKFNVYPWGTTFRPVGAVYLILVKNGNNFNLLYIGQTGDLAERFIAHHKQNCFDRYRKTHIATLPEPHESSRLRIELDLIRKYNPVCND